MSKDHLDKVLIVDVPLGILLPMHQLLHLLLTHLLPQPCQQVPQLHCRDQTIPLLVKMLETLHKVIHGVSDRLAGDILEHGEEGLEGDPGVRSLTLHNRIGED